MPVRLPAFLLVLLLAAACGSNDSGMGGGGEDENTPPPSPSSVTAEAGDQLVTVQWERVAVSDLDGYNVYRSQTSGFSIGNATRITPSPVDETRVDDDGVDNETTYYYRVTAVDLSGLEGEPSGEVSATPLLPPSVPSNVEADPGDQTVTLTWDAATGSRLAGYDVHRATTSGFEPSADTRVNGETVEATTFEDTGLTNGTVYYYRIVTVNDLGDASDGSDEVDASPFASPPGRP